MSNYDDDQSEDGELARSPINDEMDFRLVGFFSVIYYKLNNDKTFSFVISFIILNIY